MTAHVTIEGLRDPDTDWKGRPLATVGDRATLVVKLHDYATLAGGRFSIKHPAMAPEGIEFDVPARRATGSRWFLGVLGDRETLPTDLSREETIDCEVTFTRPCDAHEPFVLTAITNCVCEGAPDVKLRAVATASEFSALRISVRSGDGGDSETRYNVARAGNAGITARVGNTIRACVRLFAEFHYTDPDGEERPFPTGTPVKVLLGDNPRHAIDAAIEDGGKLTLRVIGHTDVVEAKTLTLRFGASSDNLIACEKPGDPKAHRRGAEPAESDPTGTRDERFFTLPREWTLRQADWTVTNDDGRWVADQGHVKMVKNNRAASLGTATARAKFVLDPHWQFVKFTFFDRQYGHSDHGDAVKTMPAVVLEGFRYKPTSATAKPDVRSNWWIVESDETLQCVPWIIQRNANGTASKRPSGKTLLRFALPEKTCMHSESATVRKRVIATDEQLKPGPERLKFYDLPKDWNSRNYYTKLSATAHEFGWYDQVASKPSSKTKPFVFSLDDIVLTDDAGRRLATWTHDLRLAIFANTFDDTLPNTSKEGVYKPDTGDKKPWYTTKPASGAPEESENYVVDRPGWVRMIAAAGNLFDVFDRRTVASSPANPDYDVIGARAGVCWVDTTVRMGNAEVWQPHPTQAGYIQRTSDDVIKPTRTFRNNPPERSDHAFMSVQPYYSQDYVARFGKYLDTGSTGGIGRFDMALVRCCAAAVVDGKPIELATNVWFHRVCFDATLGPASGSIEDYQVAFVRNILNRFNGLDAKNGQGRAVLLPKDATKPIKVTQVTCMEVTPEDVAHYKIKLTDSSKGARDWRSGSGTGETGNAAPQDSGNTNGFVNAHEHGHQSAFPDEYNERWDAASYGQASFYSTLPGDPYEMDGRTIEFQEDNSPLMNGNHTMHNRYFWQAAEWVRLASSIAFKVKLGGTYEDYWLPPHPTTHETKRHYAFWPLSPSKNDTAIAARAPLTVNRGKVDLYLYAIGADSFAKKALPAKEDPPGTTPYDGILMVTLRVKVSAWGVKRESESDLKKVAHALARVGRRLDSAKPRKLNHTWVIKGVHGRGTPQEWVFSRCLVHFSPRLVISGVTELETVSTVEGKMGTYTSESIWTGWKQKLVDYHAIGWDDTNKPARLDAVIGPMTEPTIAMRGGWSSTYPSLSGVVSALSTYESKPATPVLDRFNAAEAVKSAAVTWLNDVANQSNSRYGAVYALWQRADAAKKALAALYYVRDLEEKAADLKKRNTKQEEKVTQVTTAHAPQFNVVCKAGTPAKAEWDPLPIEGDLPAVDAWVNLVPASTRHGAVFERVKGLLTSYKSKDALDLAGRIKALTDLIGPAVIAPEPSPRGAWTDGGKPGLAVIGTQLSTFESAGVEDCDARQQAVVGAQSIAVAVADIEGTDQADVKAAEALVKRTDVTLFGIQFRRQVRSLEAHATLFKAHLDRWVSSTTVTLTADTPDGFEDMMLQAIPSMLGAYKAASKVAEEDIIAIAKTLNLESLRVEDLTDAGPPELPSD